MTSKTLMSESILQALTEINNDLNSGDVIGPSKISHLNEIATPFQIMQVLIPYLFQETSDGLSHSEALSVLVALVSTDNSSSSRAYLSAASVMVHKEVLHRCESPSPEKLFISDDFLELLVSQLNGDDTLVAENASQVLVMVSRRLGTTLIVNILRLLDQAYLIAWHQMLTGSAPKATSTVVVRCAAAMVDLALVDDNAFRCAIEAGVGNAWMLLVKYDSDPLLQISALDLIEKLAVTQPYHPSRTRWLFQTENTSESILWVALKLAGGYSDASSDTKPDPLLGGAALRVVAACCKLLHMPVDSDIAPETQATLLTAFHHALQNWQEGEMDRLALITAISSFAAASDDALQMVLDDSTTRQAWLSLRTVAQAKLKAAILVSVAHVLDPMYDEISTDRKQPTLGTQLFSAIGPTNNMQTTMDLLMDLVRSPLPEIRMGAYALMEATAKLPTGSQLLLQHNEFLPRLLQRENDRGVEALHAKFAIVQAIVESPIKQLLAEPVVKQLELYIEQGPHYQKARSWDVAIED